MQLDEFEGWRAPPPAPYVPGAAKLFVPRDALRATFQLLAGAGPLESCVFWYGARNGPDGTVTAVRAPAQRSSRFNYHVNEAALSHMAATISDELRPLAQIHSHPGHDVEHSRYDDAMAMSRRALSLVFPHYGRMPSSWPQRIGVHEWQHGYWHLLVPDIAARRVELIDGQVSVEDLR
jgi:hypothetical protein